MLFMMRNKRTFADNTQWIPQVERDAIYGLALFLRSDNNNARRDDRRCISASVKSNLAIAISHSPTQAKAQNKAHTIQQGMKNNCQLIWGEIRETRKFKFHATYARRDQGEAQSIVGTMKPNNETTSVTQLKNYVINSQLILELVFGGEGKFILSWKLLVLAWIFWKFSLSNQWMFKRKFY